MNQLKIPLFLLLVTFMCTLAWAGGRPGSDQGFGGRAMTGREQYGSREKQRGFEPDRQGQERKSYDRRFRSNLYNDDDVYGYDATYPNGEAAYINYRSKDARARRGPEFARTSRAYSRQGGGGQRSGSDQVNSYGGGGAGGSW